ncbi:MAG: PilZ domain-containing protein, partial [Planctomycetota bacterium]
QLEDISLGGMRVRVAGSRDVEVGATYRCAFAPREGKPPIVLDALVRHREATEGARASIGFQFVGLECVPDGERITERLTRAIAQFQRARSRKGRPPRRRSGNRSERDRGDGSQA